MKFSATPTFDKRTKADLLIVPCWQGKGKGGFAASVGSLSQKLAPPIELGDFRGRQGETSLVYLGKGKDQRALLIGLGKEGDLTLQGLRLGYGSAMKGAQKVRAKSINVLIPKVAASRSGHTKRDIVAAVADGCVLSNYTFTGLKGTTPKDELPVLVDKAALIGVTSKELAGAKEAAEIGIGVAATRNLIHGNADDVTPQILAAHARALGRKFEKIKTHVFDRKRVEKEKMGLLLAVNRGSNHDPAFIIVEYRGKSSSKEKTVIIGKGVTYDTGGLSLKPTSGMETMKTDMSGAATVLGAVETAARLKLKVNVTAVVAATENGIDAKSYKPGDAYKSITGKTVEVNNTDAEGRLTLADALGYAAAKLKPTRMIDLATLTGAIVIALGEEVAGLMSNNDKLANALQKSGEQTGEAVWRMPLVKSYKKILKSDFADIRNTGSRAGSAITAGLFLQEFVGGVPWAHLDIAGVAYTDKPVGFHTQRATGFGVRLLIDYLKGL